MKQKEPPILPIIISIIFIIIGSFFYFNIKDRKPNINSSLNSINIFENNNKTIVLKDNAKCYIFAYLENENKNQKYNFYIEKQNYVILTRKGNNVILINQIKSFDNIIQLSASTTIDGTTYSSVCYLKTYNKIINTNISKIEAKDKGILIPHLIKNNIVYLKKNITYFIHFEIKTFINDAFIEVEDQHLFINTFKNALNNNHIELIKNIENNNVIIKIEYLNDIFFDNSAIVVESTLKNINFVIIFKNFLID